MIETVQIKRDADAPKRLLASYVGKHTERYRGLARFEDLPIVTKSELVENFEAHLSDEIPNLKRDLIKTLEISDLRVGRSDDLHYACGIVVEQTSGTSGIVLLVPKTKVERLRASLAINEYRRHFDPQFQQKLFYPLVHPPRGIDRPFSPGLLTKKNITELYEYLNVRSIRWIHINPRLLQAHLELIDSSLVSGGTIRFIENTGFALSDDLRFEIERKWNVRVVDQYGCRETWVIGVRNDTGPFSIIDQNVLVEIVDEKGLPVDSPGTEGRVVISSIHQRLFPIVRYDTGDLGAWEAIDSDIRLRLAACRALSHTFLRGKKYNGIEIFKEILYGVYRALGIHSIKYIQIQQYSAYNFKVVTFGVSHRLELTTEIERRFNALYRVDRDFLFESIELTEEQSKVAIEAKPALFIRKDVSASTGSAS